MYLVTLEITDPTHAGAHAPGHAAWIDRGVEDGVFLLVGSVPGRGGAILARRTSEATLSARVHQDPFVAHGVATPTITEIVPSRIHPELAAAVGR
ncbi:hypothetical protein GH723_03455 [Actinomarinicola tropica]|uniref:YCII-related domain-containing protein n=1 Tax=Actinomarinicola tropica TaxID=2789776 RepID=A0A5Q2RUV2_9ACTN|nr:hypothetical protein GH723_03455 [Actinomarinicola tropica]